MVRPWLIASVLLGATPLRALGAEDPLALAQALQRQHRFSAAEQTLEALLERDPDHLGANLQRASLEHFVGDDQAAFECLRRAAMTHAESLEAQVMLVHANLWLGRFDDAERQAARTMARWQGRDPDPVLWSRLLVGLAGARGLRIRREGLWAAVRYGTAIRSTLEKAYALDPDGLMPMYALGRYFLEAPPVIGGDPPRGLALIRRAAGRDPDNYGVRADFVRYLIRSDRKAEARAELAAYGRAFADVPRALAVMRPIAAELE